MHLVELSVMEHRFTGRFGTHKAEVMFDRMCRENGISDRRAGEERTRSEDPS